MNEHPVDLTVKTADRGVLGTIEKITRQVEVGPYAIDNWEKEIMKI